jgi:hypothetical protein
MASRLEFSLGLVGLEMHQRREQEDHVAALVHDGGVTEGAADFTRELVLDRLGGGVVPFEVVVAVREVDVFFVEDSCPLERSGCIGSETARKHTLTGGYIENIPC